MSPAGGAIRPPHSASARQRELELKSTCDALRTLPKDSPDAIEQALSRYVVVRSVGYVESVRDDAADRYASTVGHQRLRRRIGLHLHTGQGASPGQLLTFLGSFEPQWRDSLDEFLSKDDGKIKSDLGAMVAARKRIAHGDGENVTPGRALAWSDTARAVASFLDGLFV